MVNTSANVHPAQCEKDVSRPAVPVRRLLRRLAIVRTMHRLVLVVPFRRMGTILLVLVILRLFIAMSMMAAVVMMRRQTARKDQRYA